MIVGTGIDLVDISRFERLLTRWGKNLTNRLFTDGEREYCERHRVPAIHYAVRLAAKESCLKAMGEGVGAIAWKDMEVITSPTGEPALRVTGKGRWAMEQKGIGRFSLSLSHTVSLAIAVVIALKAGE